MKRARRAAAAGRSTNAGSPASKSQCCVSTPPRPPTSSWPGSSSTPDARGPLRRSRPGLCRADGPLPPPKRRHPLRGRAAGAHRAGGRHARLRLFDGGHAAAGPGAEGGAGAARRSADRFRGQGQSQCRGAGDAGGGRARRGRRLGRRISARPRGRHRGGEDRLFRGRQDRGGDEARAGGRALPVQPGIGGRGRDAVARSRWSMGRTAPVGFRVNPDVAAGTHAKISTGAAHNKFGISIEDALQAYARARDLPGLEIRGVAVHIGSQLTSLAPLEAAFEKIGALIRAPARGRARDPHRRSRRRARRRLRSGRARAADAGGLWRDGEPRRRRLGREADLRAGPASSPAMPACCSPG